MSYVLRFRPEVVDDVAEAYGWYEGRRGGLGAELLQACYETLAAIVLMPEGYQ